MLITTDGATTLYTYLQEALATPGTVASGTYLTLRTKTGIKSDLKRDTFTSKERRSDRMESAMSYGNKSGSLSLPIEWSYGSFDPILEAVLGGTWAGNVLKIGSTARTFTVEETSAELALTEQVLGTQFTSLSISQKNNGIAEGDFSAIFRDIHGPQTNAEAPITLTYAGAGPFTITRSTAGFITVDGWAVGDTVCGRGNTDAGNNNATPWVITGLSDTVMTFAAAAGFVIKAAASGMVLNNATRATAVTAPSTLAPFDSFTGSVSEGGSVLANITGWDLKVENASQLNFTLNNPVAQSTSIGTIKVSGNLTVYYTNQNLRKKFFNGTVTALTLILGSVAATKAYTLTLGTVKYTSNSRDDAELARTETIGFTATFDVTNASTLMITRTP